MTSRPLALYSASQITVWRECQRKWGWRYIAGIKTPQHPSAALGTEVDDTQLQPYLRDGRPFDFTRDSGYIAAAGLAYLPQPKTPGLEVQKHFVLPSPASQGAFAFQGYMDLWLPDSAAVPDMPGGAPFVGDFKTTSDLKWAKNEATLSTDVQAMLYATAAIVETKNDKVDLSWMYFQTRGPRKTKRTYLRVPTDHVVEQFREIERTAVELHAAKTTVTDVLALPPSPSQCEAYGGCPYRHKCNLAPTDHLAALAAQDNILTEIKKGLAGAKSMSNPTTSLLANLAARKKTQGATPPTVGGRAEVSSPASSPAQPSAEPEVSEELKQHIAANPRAAFLLQPPGSRPLGINPPEKDAPIPFGEAAPAPAAPPKRGPGRPKKAPADPLGADVMAAVVPNEKVEAAVDRAAQAQLNANIAQQAQQAAQAQQAFANARAGAPDIDYARLATAIVDAFIARLGGAK